MPEPIQPIRVALVTGGAQRIGAAIAEELHAAGCRVLLHYRSAAGEASELAAQLNARRAESCALLQADLCVDADVQALASKALAVWGRLDLLVNNASTFYATPIGTANAVQWEDLMGSNLKGPFLLSQALAPALAESGGAIVNIVDIHVDLPLREHAVYTMAKAGLAQMTRALALDLGPSVRVNAVAPGAILWPAQPNSELSEERADELLQHTALKRIGNPSDIAGAVRYLGLDAPYVTGQILAVDGGRLLY